jgi:hypothetical protein
MKKVVFKKDGTIQYNDGNETMTFTTVSALVNHLNANKVVLKVEDCETEE